MMALLRGLGARLAGPGAARVLPAEAGAARPLALAAGMLSFLAVVALGLGLAGQRLAGTWQGALAGTATLQVLAAEDEVEAQARAALDVLRETGGVRAVRMIDVDEQRRLLEPWLGAQAAAEDLPLPLLIEVSADPAALDLPALRARLATEAPGAIYDDHGGWRAPLVASALRVRDFGWLALGLLGGVLLAVVVVAARGTAAVQTRAIDTLRLVGARDGFISGAVARPLALRAAAGAAVGAAAGALVLATLPQDSEPGFFLAGIGLAGWQWLLPLLVPAAAAVLAWAGADAAIRRRMRRWP